MTFDMRSNTTGVYRFGTFRKLGKVYFGCQSLSICKEKNTYVKQ